MCRYILKNKKYFIGTLCTSLFAGVVPLFLAYVIQLISDVAFNNHFEKAGTCLFASVLFLVYTLMTTSINSIMKSTYRKKLKTNLGEDLYSSLMNQSYSTFKKEKIGNQLSLFTNDIKMVDEYYFYPILSIPRWRSHPIHENRATKSIWTEPCNPLLSATKSTKRTTSA